MEKVLIFKNYLVLATAVLSLSACEFAKEPQGIETITTIPDDAGITLDLYSLAEAKIHCSVWSTKGAGDVKNVENSEQFLENIEKGQGLRLSGIEDLRLFLSGIQTSQFTIDEIQTEIHIDIQVLLPDLGISTDYVAGQITARFEEGARKERDTRLFSTGLGDEISDYEAKQRYNNRNCDVLDDTNDLNLSHPIFATD